MFKITSFVPPIWDVFTEIYINKLLIILGYLDADTKPWETLVEHNGQDLYSNTIFKYIPLNGLIYN
jgi:hypothetical protein